MGGQIFKVKSYYKIKADKEYPWPCKVLPDRTIGLFDNDILTRSEDGTFMKQTGLGCFNIPVPDEDLLGPLDKPVTLQMM